jgi:ferrous iron transport protein A
MRRGRIISRESDMVELLEIIRDLTQNGRQASIDQIVVKMARSLEEVQRLTGMAVNTGFAHQIGGGIELTETGEALIKGHQKEHVQEMHENRRSLAHRLSRFLKRDVTDWSEYGRHDEQDDKSHGSLYRCVGNVQAGMGETVALTDLQEGEKSAMVLAQGGRRLIRRLAELGLTPGTEVIVIRSAPMHGPIEISVRGVSLALGRGIARRVRVKRTTNHHPDGI